MKIIYKDIIKAQLIGISYFTCLPLLTIFLNSGIAGLSLDFSGILTSSSFARYPVRSIAYLSLGMSSLALLLFGCLKLFFLKYKKMQEKPIKNKIYTIAVVYYGLMMILYVYLVPASVTKWNERIEWLISNYGFLATIFLYLQRGLRDLACVVAIAGNYRLKKLAPLILLLSFEMIFTGNRIFFVMFILAFFLRNGLSFKDLKYAIFYIPIGLFFMAWSTVRGLIGSGISLAKALEIGMSQLGKFNILSVPYAVSEGANAAVLVALYNDWSLANGMSFLYGKSFFDFLNFFTGVQTDSVAVIAAKTYYPTLDGFSLNTTLVGELIMNFGSVGIIYKTTLFIVIFTFLLRIILSLRILNIYATGLVFYLVPVFWRGNFSDRFIQSIIVLTLLYLFHLFNLKKSF